MAAASAGAQRRTERLLNLVVYLLGTERGVSRADLREGIDAYRTSPSSDAFERMFERDKQDLRDLGIPLITEGGAGGFADQITYRIDRSDYQLPDVTFDAAERAVLVVAARAWEQAALGSAAAGALRKLGVAGDLVPLPPLTTSVETPDSAFADVYAAVQTRTPIAFDYLAVNAEQPATRHLEPWVLVSRNGSWYVAGYDRDRDAARVFRLSRFAGSVATTGPEGSIEVPPSALQRAAALELIAPDSEAVSAAVRVRAGAGQALRRRARSLTHRTDGWDALVIEGTDMSRLVSELAGYGPDVIVDEPGELRAQVVSHLTAVARVAAGTQEASA
jgi:proteasome accessory factor B